MEYYTSHWRVTMVAATLPATAWALFIPAAAAVQVWTPDGQYCIW